MNSKLKTKEVDHLFDAVLTLESKEECYKFFEDVCTINELLSMAQRYEVAKMLREGETDGYDMVFSRLGLEDNLKKK